MNTQKITSDEISDKRVSSLPTHPTSSALYGGSGLSAEEMKAAFDRLPLFIIERFNSLIDDISASGSTSAAASIPTDIADGHTLYDLFSDITNGNFASYMKIDGVTLAEIIAELKERCGI